MSDFERVFVMINGVGVGVGSEADAGFGPGAGARVLGWGAG